MVSPKSSRSPARCAERTPGAGRRRFLAAAGATALVALAGCAAAPTLRPAWQAPADLPRRVELADTPFFPDDTYYCGPAALATVLGAAGLAVSVDTLADQVFVPARRGSLQIEMLVAARRGGAVATLIPGEREALMRELAAGHPVVVLQNLGLSWAPAWHYAVVVGYDLERGHFILRSGAIERELTSFRTFEHTWARSGRWAFVALPPGQLPASATELEATRALVAFERGAPPEAAERGYAAALAHWPASLILAMGLGNTRYAQGDLTGAEAAFGDAARRHDAPAAHHNLAVVLLELGRPREARAAAERALAANGALGEAARATLARIDAVENGPDSPR